MADEWATGDGFDKIKLNRKTRFVGTSEQAVAFIDSPQIGQQVFSTESTSHSDSFTHDKLATYNSSSSWVNPNLDENSYTYAGVTDTSNTGAFSVRRMYDFITLPTTEKFYVISQLKSRLNINNGTTSNTQMGVDIVNASPPTLADAPLAAISNVITYTNSGSSGVYDMTSTVVASKAIRGGTILGVWVISDNMTSTGQIRFSVGSSINREKIGAYSGTPNFSNSTAWTASTSLPFIEVVYKGYI